MDNLKQFKRQLTLSLFFVIAFVSAVITYKTAIAVESNRVKCLKKWDTGGAVILYPDFLHLYCEYMKKTRCYVLKNEPYSFKNGFFRSVVLDGKENDFVLSSGNFVKFKEKCGDLKLFSTKKIKFLLRRSYLKNLKVYLKSMLDNTTRECPLKGWVFLCSNEKWNHFKIENENRLRYLKLHLNQWKQTVVELKVQNKKKLFLFFGFTGKAQSLRTSILGFGRIQVFQGTKQVFEQIFSPEDGITMKAIEFKSKTEEPQVRLKIIFDGIGSRFGEILFQAGHLASN